MLIHLTEEERNKVADSYEALEVIEICIGSTRIWNVCNLAILSNLLETRSLVDGWRTALVADPLSMVLTLYIVNDVIRAAYFILGPGALNFLVRSPKVGNTITEAISNNNN